jgi:hypothetical protein
MMAAQTADDKLKREAYGKDETFNIQVGMAVHNSDGQLLGTIAEVAGFGATHIHDASRKEGAQEVTQTQSATGFIKIDRRAVVGERDVPSLTVPFHGVQTITPEHGVVLNDTVLAELRALEQRSTMRAAEGDHVRGYGRGDGETVGELKAEELREESALRKQRGAAETVSDIVVRRGISATHDPEFTLGGGSAEQSAFDEEMKS